MAELLFFIAAPQVDQKLAEEHYQKGATYFRNGRVNDALREFEDVTRLTPNDARGWKGLGVAFASQGDNRHAEEPLRKACELDARDQDACYYLGLASYNLGRYKNAIEAYEKALKTRSRIAGVRSGLGLTFEALGRSEEAERELREAVKTDDGKSTPDFDPHVELGAFLFRQGRTEAALQALEKAVEVRPESPRGHFELARALVQYGRLNDAEAHLQRAVVLDPNYGAAHLLLGRVYFRLGRTEEGERETQIGQRLSASKP